VKAFLLTESHDVIAVKSPAKKNTKIVSSSHFLNELHKTLSESVWLTHEPSIIEDALKGSDIFDLRSSLKKRTNILILGEAKKSWEPTLNSLFKKAFVFAEATSLSIVEILEIFASKNPSHFVIGGNIENDLKLLVLTRGDLSTLAIPLSAFRESGDNIVPDFEAFSVVDGGQTLKFGEYEASVDSVLYELDPDYRKYLKTLRTRTDKSFGACLKRLRLQKGLLQSDFGEIDEKVIGRIERGEVSRPRDSTLDKIAETLGVRPEEIVNY
jgi:DNA-binding Xre family transcriptional regulator